MGGLSLANVSFKDDPQVTVDPTNRRGFIAGVGYEFAMTPSLVLEIDALYFQKGFKYEEMRGAQIQIGNDTYTYEDRIVMKTDVISVPALLKLRLGTGAFIPYVGAGFEGAFVLSNKVDYTGVTYKNGEVDSEEKSTEDVKEYTESFDYGPVFNAGLEFGMGSTRLVVDGRYHLGMANMLKLDDVQEDVNDDSWIKSKAWVLMVGLKF
jgi:outer membrane protein W